MAQVSAAREAANAELVAAIEAPPASLDLATLAELVQNAVTVGVPAADVAAAGGVLGRVTGLREAARAELEAATGGASRGSACPAPCAPSTRRPPSASTTARSTRAARGSCASSSSAPPRSASSPARWAGRARRATST